MTGMELREKDTMAHSCSAANTATHASDTMTAVRYTGGRLKRRIQPKKILR
jgi:hypothetical protein